MSVSAYREGIDGLRERLRVDVGVLEERVTALGPLRRVLLGDGDGVLDLVRGLRTDVAQVDSIDDGARLMEMIQSVERAAQTLEDALDASTRALAARPPLREEVDPQLRPGLHEREIDVLGLRVFLRERVVGVDMWRRTFTASLTVSVPLRLPAFVVRSRNTLEWVASLFLRRIVDHPAFDRYYALDGNVDAAKALLSRPACDALVRIPLPQVRLAADEGTMRLVCGHGARPAPSVVGKIPTSAIQALGAILRVIEEA